MSTLVDEFNKLFTDRYTRKFWLGVIGVFGISTFSAIIQPTQSEYPTTATEFEQALQHQSAKVYAYSVYLPLRRDVVVKLDDKKIQSGLRELYKLENHLVGEMRDLRELKYNYKRLKLNSQEQDANKREN